MAMMRNVTKSHDSRLSTSITRHLADCIYNNNRDARTELPLQQLSGSFLNEASISMLLLPMAAIQMKVNNNGNFLSNPRAFGRDGGAP